MELNKPLNSLIPLPPAFIPFFCLLASKALSCITPSIADKNLYACTSYPLRKAPKKTSKLSNLLLNHSEVCPLVISASNSSGLSKELTVSPNGLDNGIGSKGPSDWVVSIATSYSSEKESEAQSSTITLSHISYPSINSVSVTGTRDNCNFSWKRSVAEPGGREIWIGTTTLLPSRSSRTHFSEFPHFFWSCHRRARIRSFGVPVEWPHYFRWFRTQHVPPRSHLKHRKVSGLIDEVVSDRCSSY